MKQIICFIGFLAMLPLTVYIAYAQNSYSGNIVVLEGKKDSWKIIVNGDLFHLKGVGVSRPLGKFGR